MSWLDWKQAETPRGAGARPPTSRGWSRLRHDNPVLRCRHFLHGKDELAPGILDIAWFDAHGRARLQRVLEQSGGARCWRCAAPRRNDDGNVPILTAVPQSERPRTAPSACRRRSLPTRLLLDSADAGQAPSATSRARRSRSARAQRRADQERAIEPTRHDVRSPRSAVRRDAARRRPHALPPLGAAAATGLGRDRGPRRGRRCGALADGWFEAEAACGAGARYRYRARRRARPCPIRPRARRRTTCMARAWSSIRAPIAGATPDWRGRPWHETVLYELHAGAARRLRRRAARAAAAGRARHHRGRADAGQRFSRRSATGATTACCRSRRTAPTARPTSSRRWSMPRTSSA